MILERNCGHEKLNLRYKMDPPHFEANVDNPINIIQ